jgi:phosphatidylserine synthase
MFWLGFGIYTIFIILIFSFFIVAKIHIYKFRHYNIKIEPVTKLLSIILLVLALIGYYLLFSNGTGNVSIRQVDEPTTTEIY